MFTSALINSLPANSKLVIWALIPSHTLFCSFSFVHLPIAPNQLSNELCKMSKFSFRIMNGHVDMSCVYLTFVSKEIWVLLCFVAFALEKIRLSSFFSFSFFICHNLSIRIWIAFESDVKSKQNEMIRWNSKWCKAFCIVHTLREIGFA